MSRFYITTAIPYANGAPHIGHAYERIATDAIQRFMRLDGRETLFVTGMDEYGLKVQQTAAREGVTPQEFVDAVAAQFEAMGEALNARADDIRAHHASATQALGAGDLWRRMQANGDIYLSKYAGWYSVRDEAYFDEGELTDGPDGAKLAPSGAPAQWVEEESYFFRLVVLRRAPARALRGEPGFRHAGEIPQRDRRLRQTGPERSLDQPRQPRLGRAGARRSQPCDVRLGRRADQLLSATGFPDGGARAQFWPADAHVIGKDITRFHAIYWPAFLMSAKLPVPRQIVVHGFLFNRGEKMSKSLGNVVSPADLIASYGVDPLRYFFLREVPFGQDGNYSHEAIVQRINADLANDIGNLAQRSLTMIAKNCSGHVPDWRGAAPGDEDLAMLAAADALLAQARAHLSGFALHLYAGAVFDVVAEANRYFAKAEPWRLAKSDPARMRLVLYVTIETLRIVAILLQPIMPASMGRLLDLLGVGANARDFASLGADAAGRLDAPGRLATATPLPPPSPIFPRYVEPAAEAAAR